ncbi:MAG: hypothetical protein V2A58_16400 [Planctomycetota bacterium]
MTKRREGASMPPLHSNPVAGEKEDHGVAGQGEGGDLVHKAGEIPEGGLVLEVLGGVCEHGDSRAVEARRVRKDLAQRFCILSAVLELPEVLAPVDPHEDPPAIGGGRIAGQEERDGSQREGVFQTFNLRLSQAFGRAQDVKESRSKE